MGWEWCAGAQCSLLSHPLVVRTFKLLAFNIQRFRCRGYSLKLFIHLGSGTNCRHSFFAHHPAFDLNPSRRQLFSQSLLFGLMECFSRTRRRGTHCSFFDLSSRIYPSIPVNRGQGEETVPDPVYSIIHESRSGSPVRLGPSRPPTMEGGVDDSWSWVK